MTYPAVSVLPYSMTSGALFGSLKAAFMRCARVSTGMYSMVTLVSLWAFSKVSTAASTTFSFGALLTSWKSQTRRVPDFSSFPEAELPELWGAQAVATRAPTASAVAAAAVRTERFSGSFIERPPVGVRCNMRNGGFALHNTPEAMEYMNMPTRGLHHSVTTGRTPCNARTTKPRHPARGCRGPARPTRRAAPRGRAGAYFLSPPLSLSPPAPMDS